MSSTLTVEKYKYRSSKGQIEERKKMKGKVRVLYIHLT